MGLSLLCQCVSVSRAVQVGTVGSCEGLNSKRKCRAPRNSRDRHSISPSQDPFLSLKVSAHSLWDFTAAQFISNYTGQQRGGLRG